MQTEIKLLIEQLRDAYEGEPWFGRSVKELLNEVNEKQAFVKLNDQHSFLELVWHMVTWREFTVHCLQPSSDRSLKYFEDLDWRELDHTNLSLWPEGLRMLDESQERLLAALQQQDDSILNNVVKERNYNYRKLITGVIQHDIYHLGQIAYLNKALKNS
ncbi:MAG TPA: DinB family protein [Flavisolibacter sp.]